MARTPGGPYGCVPVPGPATLNLDGAVLAGCLEADFEARDGGLWYGETPRLAVGESPLARRTKPRGRLAAVLAAHQLGSPLYPTMKDDEIDRVIDAVCQATL